MSKFENTEAIELNLEELEEVAGGKKEKEGGEEESPPTLKGGGLTRCFHTVQRQAD